MKKFAIFALVMVIGAGTALATTLELPFFRDNDGSEFGAIPLSDGFITVKDSSGAAQTVTVIYTALNATLIPTDQTVTFALGANQAISWNPVQSTTNEGAGIDVPDMNIVNNGGLKRINGSAVIIGVGLSGRYNETDSGRKLQFGHVLLAQ